MSFSLYHIVYLILSAVVIADTIRLFILRYRECGNDGMEKNKARRKLLFNFFMIIVFARNL